MSCIQNRSSIRQKILLRYFQERNKRKIKLRSKLFLCGLVQICVRVITEEQSNTTIISFKLKDYKDKKLICK